MNAFTDKELIRVLLGQAPPDMALAVDERAARDEDLAAKLDVLRQVVGAWDPTPPVVQEPSEVRATVAATPAPRRWPLRRLAKLAACILAVVTLSGLAYAGYAWWTAPLFADDFKSGWFDSSKWRAPPEIIPDAGVYVDKGQARLINRGYLVTVPEFTEPIEISFDWKWSQLGLLPQYADHLTVALRTTGKPRPERSWEVHDGILIVFDAYRGSLTISTPEDNDPQPSLPMASLPMPAERWHRIRITDDGKNIAIYLNGPEIPAQFADKPVATRAISYKGDARHVALYNREMLKSIPHESSIRGFVIRALK